MNSGTVTLRRRIGALSKTLWRAAFLLVCLLAAHPAAAEPLPALEEIALPEESEVLKEVAAAMAKADTAPSDCVASLDRSLTRLDRPTPFRGMVQILRAGCLESAGRLLPDGLEAVLESILLLPRHSGPLLYASSIYTYSDQPAKAADMLLRAIEVDPDPVREMPAYELGGLLRRLGEQDGDDRRALLAERLLGLGWVEGDVSMRSDLAE